MKKYLNVFAPLLLALSLLLNGCSSAVNDDLTGKTLCRDGSAGQHS